MLFQSGHASKHKSLLPTAAPFWEPGRVHSVPCTQRRKQVSESKRRGARPQCSSAPQQWRSLQTQHPASSRKLPGSCLADGPTPPPLMSVAGWALVTLVAFNLLRSLVLMWVNSQRRSSRLRQTSVSAEPTAEPAAVGTSRNGSQPPTAPLLSRTAAASDGAVALTAVAESGNGAGTSELAVAPGAVVDKMAITSAVAAPEFVAVATAAVAEHSAVAGPTGLAGLPNPHGESEGDAGKDSTQIVASYQMRPRGGKSNSNLGRVVICATLDLDLEPGFVSGSGSALADLAPWGSVEWHRRFWEPLLSKYADSPADRVTGLLLLYGRSVLHIIEGDNNQLFALLRELRQDGGGIHRLQEIRVPCYILDLRERLFDSWQCATAIQRPIGRHRLTRAAFKAPVAAAIAGAVNRGTGINAAATTATGPGGGPMPALIGPVGEASSDSTAESGAAASPEHQLVSRIQQLELFIKFVGPKLSSLASPEARNQALRNLCSYETTTPPEDVVAALATDPLAPELHEFVTAFDADYHRYVSLMALVAQLEEEMEDEAAVAAAGGRTRLVARASSLLGEINHLARFYEEHVRRDIREALAQREEERRSRGLDEVTRRLSQGMRLRAREGAQVAP
ncbi:hypothetical protein Vretimale_255 [Volvox reticuliferus]|uniref:BLUF domain-containing protein n=1 Tax=Volvox reticuliferus TaxID=1737510 RepID=A0A8J4D1K8_9CHLO|nr:hypothetical protein Vretifemale_8187 [Volvox reticuliferus]GIL93979.1 hypothetical protein Vretimale_255 [Volvox reticuliferus]